MRAIHVLPAYRAHRSDGSTYVTSLALGVTLEEARAYFMGATQYLDIAETQPVTVIDVTVAWPSKVLFE